MRLTTKTTEKKNKEVKVGWVDGWIPSWFGIYQDVDTTSLVKKGGKVQDRIHLHIPCQCTSFSFLPFFGPMNHTGLSLVFFWPGYLVHWSKSTYDYGEGDGCVVGWVRYVPYATLQCYEGEKMRPGEPHRARWWVHHHLHCGGGGSGSPPWPIYRDDCIPCFPWLLPLHLSR